jgi:hypothetical protein
MHLELCKEQQHSQKQEFFVIMVQLKLLRGFKPAGLTVFISLSLSVHFACSSGVNLSSLHVSIMWFSCKLGPLIWGIVACTLRAQWTSTSAVRRLRSLTGE